MRTISENEGIQFSDLVRPLLLAFADLKHHKYTYWMAMPAISPRTSLIVSASAMRRFPDKNALQAAYATLPSGNLAFLLFEGRTLPLDKQGLDTFFADTATMHVVCADQGVALDGVDAMGWAARNLLFAISVHAGRRGVTDSFTVSLLLIRNNQRGRAAQQLLDVETDQSMCVDLVLSPYPVATVAEDALEHLQIVGWEPNERSKPGPRLAVLSSSDKSQLVAQAADLNLRLMKWRLWPDLDLAKLSDLRCLLLGAGTLGCYVARALVGYGCKNITFVDSGRVSYSNPTRQCLFTQADALAGEWKANVAAQRIRDVNSQVNAAGVVLAIPMPGHPFTGTSAEDAVIRDQAAVQRLHELVESHDVVFLLTDSREARWLPTVLCKASNKLCMNAALGFDSYLVMHHTAPRGCYFCNDLVSAGNSFKNRGMDELCTITRPGVAMMASSLVVELMVSLLHTQADGDPLSVHQIRGSVADFSQQGIQTPAFAHCTACCDKVVQAYLEDPAGFVCSVCEKPTLLEDVSGAKALIEAVDIDDLVLNDEDF